jgi:hypothetical protein
MSGKRGTVAQVYAHSGDNNPGVRCSGGKAVEPLRIIGTSLGIVYTENILFMALPFQMTEETPN